MITSSVSWITGYLIPWLCGFLVFGVVLQVIDMYTVKYEDVPWVPSYRKWYNRSRSPDQYLPPGTMGWFYNQPLRRRHNRAMLISGIQAIVSVPLGTNAVLAFLAFLGETWATLPGLYLGLFAFNYLWRQDEILGHADDLRTQMMGLTWNSVLAKLLAPFSRRGTIANMAPVSSPAATPVTPNTQTSSASAPAQPAAPQLKPRDSGMSAAEILARHKDGRAI